MKKDRIMTAAEFFGEAENGTDAGDGLGARTRKRHANKTFADIKARMVMRIYGVTRSKAERIIAEREAAKAAVNPNGAKKSCDGDDAETLMSAEDFFGL